MQSINKLGYKDISPYKNSPYLDIQSPSGAITMKGVSTPLLAITDQGERRMMYPGEEHQFNSKLIREIPMRRYYQGGGEMQEAQMQEMAQQQQSGQPQPGEIIAAYIELNGLGQKDAEQIYKAFYAMTPEDKQALLGNMMSELQEAQGGQDPNEQQEQQMQDPQMQQQEMMEQEMTMPDGQQAMMVGGVPIFSPHVYGYSKQYQGGGQYIYDDNYTQNMDAELMNAAPVIQRRSPVAPLQPLPNLRQINIPQPRIDDLERRQPTPAQFQELLKMMIQNLLL